MAELSAYMAAATSRPLPEAVAEAARHHLLDTFAAMVSGAGLLPGRQAHRYARAQGGSGPATIAAAGLACLPAEAALVNGMLAHADETDDSHAASASHPGCAVVPAALAVGEALGLDGARFLRAVALGYDVGPRVNLALGAWKFRGESHRSTHSIAGTFGAAAARQAAAAGLMRSACAGCWTMRRSRPPASPPGAATRTTSRRPSSSAACRRATASPRRCWCMAGRRGSRMSSQVPTISYRPCGGREAGRTGRGPRPPLRDHPHQHQALDRRLAIQAPLDALDLLRRRRSFAAAEVRAVEVRLAGQQARVVDSRDMPDICLQHMVAIMLLDGTASFEAAHDVPRMRDAAVLRERAKVTLQGDAALEALLPRREAVVTVTLADGTTLTERVGEVRGTTANPMTRQEVVEKARDLLAPVLGAEQAARLIEASLGIEALADLRPLRPLLQAG